MKSILLILSLGFSLNLYAHEGDHGPQSFQAQKGGVTQSLETVHLELTEEPSILKLYVYTPKGEPDKVSKYPVTGKILLPMKKTMDVKLEGKGTYWEIPFTPPTNAHRYTLELKITQGGHNDTVLLTIERSKKK